jgi:cell division protein FtsQ
MPNGLKMLNRNFDYQIDFGRMINVERKLKNYKAFSKAVLIVRYINIKN